jgi:RNA polymerase-binding transcription factor DksA
MRDGTYGECIDCGCDIPEERLLANPIAVRCVQCQDMFERTHAQGATPTL